MSHQWSIVTVTYNSETAIRNSWTESRDGVEWIVVDNASTDGSVAAARATGADEVICLPRNVGFSAANNHGMSVARGDLILFANPDLRVEAGGLDSLALRLDAGAGLVAPQLLHPDGSPQPNGRGLPTLANKVLNRTTRSEHARYRLHAAEHEVVPVCFAIGAAVAGTRSFLDDLGGWDDGYFLYYEDSDLGLRSWRAGRPVELVGSVRWQHEWARATMRLALKPWLHEFRSMARFYATYPSLLGTQRAAERAFPAIAAALPVPAR